MADRWQAEREAAAARSPVVQALTASLREDPGALKAASELTKLRATRQGQAKLALPVTPPAPAPKPSPPPPRPQPISAVVTPPYSLDSQWLTTHGVTPATSTSGNKTTGQISVDLSTQLGDPADPSSAAGTGFVGIRLPTVPFSRATCQVWTNPSLSYTYYCSSLLASASCSGFIGLTAYAFNLDGSFAGQVVNQQPALFNVSTWVTVDSDTVNESAHSLNCSFAVDSNHTYTVMIQCGGVVSANGTGFCYDSGAFIVMNATAPTFSWEMS